jgi:hypothetical protein
MKYSMKVFKDDPLGTFSSIPHNVMPTKDTRMYICVKYEEYDHKKLIDMWKNELTRDDLLVKK